MGLHLKEKLLYRKNYGLCVENTQTGLISEMINLVELMIRKKFLLLLMFKVWILASCQNTVMNSLPLGNIDQSDESVEIKTVEGLSWTGFFDRFFQSNGNQIQPVSRNIEEVKLDEKDRANFSSFGRASVEENIKAAILSHPRVIAAQKSLEVATFELEAVKSTKQLQTDIVGIAGLQTEDRETDPAASVQFSASKLIYDAGSTDFAISSKQAEIELKQEAIIVEANAVALDAYTKWTELTRFRNIHKVYSDGLKRAEPLLGQIENISASGIADKNSLLSAQQKYSELILQSDQAGAALELAETQFAEIFPGVNIDSVRGLKNFSFDVDESEVDNIILDSKILKLQKMAILVLEEQRNSLVLSEKPVVSFSSNVMAPFEDLADDATANAGLVLNYKFNDGGRLEASISSLEAQIVVLEEEAKNLIRVSRTELLAIKTQKSAAEKKYASSTKLLTLAKDLLKTSKNQLVTGRSTIKDVLDLEVKVAALEIDLINAEADRNVAAYTLYASVYGLSEKLDLSL